MAATPQGTRELQTELDSELLRGVPLPVCLSGWAKHFVPPDPGMFNVDHRDYDLSRCTDSYDEFLSHDWGTPRLLKLVSMLIIYNSGAAAGFCLLASVLCGVLQAHGVLPVDWWTLLLLHASFWIVLLFWQRLRGIFLKPATIFLDRLCIAQHDEELKQKGILGLAGFLDRSHQLTILWSHRYFSRIWCTYEVATFLRDAKNQKPILVMPVKMALTLFLFAVSEHVIMYWYVHASSVMARDVADIDLGNLWALFVSFAPVLALTVPVVFYIGLGLMQELQELPQQLANFSVQRAQCFCCSNNHKHPQTGEAIPCDRELIFGMLKRWYGNPQGEADEHLHLFDRQVKEALAPTVMRSLGRGWLPLQYTITMVCVSAVPMLSRTIAVLAVGPPQALAGYASFVWRLRVCMDYGIACLLTFSWVQAGLYVLHYAGSRVKQRNRWFYAIVLVVPACLPLSVEWFSFQLSMIHTGDDSLIPLIPFLTWTGFHILLMRFSDGPAGHVQFAGAAPDKPDRPFQEATIEVVVDEQSTSDSISVFST
ncbi:unnamed protein product [Symbiodinium sp. CCMP2592]|nr:unnamed protein product [Symbiodinium sp. CCMP2592]